MERRFEKLVLAPAMYNLCDDDVQVVSVEMIWHRGVSGNATPDDDPATPVRPIIPIQILTPLKRVKPEFSEDPVAKRVKAEPPEKPTEVAAPPPPPAPPLPRRTRGPRLTLPFRRFVKKIRPFLGTSTDYKRVRVTACPRFNNSMIAYVDWLFYQNNNQIME